MAQANQLLLPFGGEQEDNGRHFENYLLDFVKCCVPGTLDMRLATALAKALFASGFDVTDLETAVGRATGDQARFTDSDDPMSLKKFRLRLAHLERCEKHASALYEELRSWRVDPAELVVRAWPEAVRLPHYQVLGCPRNERAWAWSLRRELRRTKAEIRGIRQICDSIEQSYEQRYFGKGGPFTPASTVLLAVRISRALRSSERWKVEVRRNHPRVGHQQVAAMFLNAVGLRKLEPEEGKGKWRRSIITGDAGHFENADIAGWEETWLERLDDFVQVRLPPDITNGPIPMMLPVDDCSNAGQPGHQPKARALPKGTSN